jgi:TPR repeat protein
MTARLSLPPANKAFLLAGALLMVAGCSLIFPETFLYELRENTPERNKLRQLAESGSAEAAYRLGQSYCCGQGGDFNNEKALNWFCQAAKRGNHGAQFELGQMYEHAYTMLGWDTVTYRRRPAAGKYPQKDLVRSYLWYTVANQDGGFPMAQNRKLDLAAKEMTLPQVKRAETMLDQWREVPCGTSYMPDSDQMVWP